MRLQNILLPRSRSAAQRRCSSRAPRKREAPSAATSARRSATCACSTTSPTRVRTTTPPRMRISPACSAPKPAIWKSLSNGAAPGWQRATASRTTDEGLLGGANFDPAWRSYYPRRQHEPERHVADRRLLRRRPRVHRDADPGRLGGSSGAGRGRWSGTGVAGTDIQGVSCHEYGHALGLGHSTVGGATMFPSISGSGVGARSIAADDVAGIQSNSIPARRQRAKPRHRAAVAGNWFSFYLRRELRHLGVEVWFTRAAASVGLSSGCSS